MRTTVLASLLWPRMVSVCLPWPNFDWLSEQIDIAGGLDVVPPPLPEIVGLQRLVKEEPSGQMKGRRRDRYEARA